MIVMGERKESKDLSSVASNSQRNNPGDVRKQRDADVPSLPEGWEIRHSRSRNGKVYYVNTITKVSTWKNPLRVEGSDKGRLAVEGDLKLKTARNNPESKQPGVSAITQLREKQVLPDMTASALSKKRKAVDTTSVGLPSNKIKKNSNSSTVIQNDSQCQKLPRNRTQEGENSKSIAKYSLQKQHAVGSCNSDRTKDLEQLVNNKATKGVLAPQGEHTTSQTDTAPLRKILKPSSLVTSRPVHDCSRNLSTNFCTPEVKVTVAKNSNSCSKNTFTSGLNLVSFTVRSTASSDNKSKVTNSSLNISSHLTTKSVPELDTSNAKQSQRRHSLSCETFPYHQSLLCSSGSTNIKDSSTSCFLHHQSLLSSSGSTNTKDSSTSYFPHHQSLLSSSGSTNTKDSCHQGNSHHLNKSNNGLTPQTCLNRTAYSPSFSSSHSQTGGHSKITGDPKSQTSGYSDDSKSLILNYEKCTADSSLLRPPYHDDWLHSRDSSTWKAAANKLLDSGVSSFKLASSFNVSSAATGWSPSASGTEEEQDIEDMEVDEELEILSNLQDVRSQASTILHEPKGVLTETLTQATHWNQSDAVDSTKDVLKKVILVVDTNVFISCLKFLQDIMKCSIPGYQGIIFVMPWVVMQELDYLKNKRNSINNLSISTSCRASKAVKFIYSHIIEKNSQFIGQTPQEAVEKTDLPLESNDDRILQCCLQFQKKYPGSLLILLTRDMNLISKAVITGISASNNETLSSHLKIPKLHSGNRQASIRTDTPKTRKRSLQNTDESTGSISSTDNDRGDTTHKTNTLSGRNTPSSTPQRPVPKKANLDLPDKPQPADTHAASKVRLEPSRLPQTDADKAVVMGKFQAVWRLIHDMNSQIGEILAAGKSHANYNEAVQLLKGLAPLLSVLDGDFSRCMYLSPVILWEHGAEFTTLCAHLNSFYAEAQTVCVDPSQPVEAVQLMSHFHNTSNRSVLFAGLEQLSAFVRDVEAKLQTIS